VVSPQKTIVVEVASRIEPKMEPLLSTCASAAVCVYIGLDNIWLPW